MKKLILSVFTLTALLSFAQETAKPKISPGRLAKYRERVTREGGLVDGIIPGRDIRIVNAQSLVAASNIAEIAKSIQDTLRAPVKVVASTKPAPTPFAFADVGFEGGNTAGVVALIEDQTFPRLVIRPEEHTAIVNVAGLNTDSPSADKLAMRLRKEVWRGFGYAMGAANSNYQPCVMRDVTSLSDLDSKEIAVISPDPLMRIEPALHRLGLAQLRHATYQRACMEGWAPSPTNEWQKAIWEKVKAEQSSSPTKGIRISYDKNKGKGNNAKSETPAKATTSAK